MNEISVWIRILRKGMRACKVEIPNMVRYRPGISTIIESKIKYPSPE